MKDDIYGWSRDAIGFFLMSTPKKLLIPTIMGLFVFLVLLFRSTSTASFYVILYQIILVCIASYFLFRAFDQCLLAKAHDYYLNKLLKADTYIKQVVERVKKEKAFDRDNDPYSQFPHPVKDNEFTIVYIVQFQKRAGAINARRFLYEVILCSCIIMLINPILILAILTVIVFTLINTFSNIQSIGAFMGNEVKSLAWNIYQYHNEHPEKCKKLIMESEYEEIRNLSTLYTYLKKHTHT